MKLSKMLGEILYDLYGPNGSDQVCTNGQRLRMDVFRELERHGLVAISQKAGSIQEMKTLEDFCKQWDLTLRERKEVILYLAFLRMKATLKTFYPGL
jgi:hypothetical protein